MKNILLIGAVLVIIGILLALLFRPAPKPEIHGDLSLDQENALKANVLVLEGQNDSLRMELGKVQQKETVAQEGFKRAITTLQKENKRLSENPKVVEVRTSVPEVDSLLSLKDVIIGRMTERITEMEHSAQVTKGINEQITQNFERRLANSEQLLHDKTMEVEQSAKEIKKLRRRLFWTKVGGIVIIGGIGALAITQ